MTILKIVEHDDRYDKPIPSKEAAKTVRLYQDVVHGLGFKLARKTAAVEYLLNAYLEQCGGRTGRKDPSVHLTSIPRDVRDSIEEDRGLNMDRIIEKTVLSSPNYIESIPDESDKNKKQKAEGEKE